MEDGDLFCDMESVEKEERVEAFVEGKDLWLGCEDSVREVAEEERVWL